MDDIVLAFFEEAVDLLAQMESGLLAMEQGKHDAQTINSIFRAAHTIKGDAGIVGLEAVQKFAHALEDTLSMLRSEKIQVHSALVSVLLRCCDHIKALISDAAQGKDQLDSELQKSGVALVAALQSECLATPLATVGPHAAAELTTASRTELPREPVSIEPLGNGKTMESTQVRVQAEKLDQLLDLVGEMLSASAAAHMKACKSGQADLVEANAGLLRLVESMRELSNQLRMVRIGEVFSRFKRVARDLAQEMHRDFDLVIRGEDAELDKSIIEKIGDPLMHLLRNAIDHGIEPPEVRLARGKRARGTIGLSAHHEPGGIVIEVADDGAGIDKHRVLAKAMERGLVGPAQTLSDQDIINLIFLPGFSTVDAVSNLSGRGVGMDVVRSNITALRGSVEVQTEPGHGTRFICRLPLTMAIIDGFLVGVGRECYVIPLDMVVECLVLDISADPSGYLNLRGRALPLLSLRERFSVRTERPKKEHVVVVRWGDQWVGIVVDALHGEQQTVIKRLPSVCQHVPGISGSTILGTGAVALILDVPSLILNPAVTPSPATHRGA